MPRNPALWVTLILLVIVLFGAKRLPDAARSIGQSIKAFKTEMDPDEPGNSKDPQAGSTDTNKS
jgi:sec-independent protein translocase protein TatA